MSDTNSDEVMGNLISVLLLARNTAHMHHWKTKSFSHHLALEELYTNLLDLTDELFEIYMGQYGDEAHVHISLPNGFDENDPLNFVQQLDDFLKDGKSLIVQDGFIINKYEELQGIVLRVKYKLDNLK